MIELPKNYKEEYPCINVTGYTSEIYANFDYTEVYKIYLREFHYDEEKMREFSMICNPNIFVPVDILTVQDQSKYVGYSMAFDEGKALPQIEDAEFSSLIKSSLDIPDTLTELSGHHFLITDPNVDNITFSKTYKFVDTYSYLLLKKFSQDMILERNLKRVNISVLSGLLGFSYDADVENYFRNCGSKYLEQIKALDTRGAGFLYEYLSMVQEVTQEDSLQKVKQKLR